MRLDETSRKVRPHIDFSTVSPRPEYKKFIEWQQGVPKFEKMNGQEVCLGIDVFVQSLGQFERMTIKDRLVLLNAKQSGPQNIREKGIPELLDQYGFRRSLNGNKVQSAVRLIRNALQLKIFNS